MLVRRSAPRYLVSCFLAIGTCFALVPAGASGLPPGWTYELVSPRDSGGSDLTMASGAPDVEHAWVGGFAPISDHQQTGNSTVLLARRTMSGWATQDLGTRDTPDGQSASYELEARSTNSETAIVSSCARVLLGCNGDARFESVESDGTRTLLLDVPLASFFDTRPEFSAASTDLSTMVVLVPVGGAPLLPEDTHTQGAGLYVVHGQGQVTFLGKDEFGAVLDCGAVLGNGGNTGFQQTGVSANGRTIAYTGPDPAVGCSEAPTVYVFHNGTTSSISRPASGPGNGAKFVGLSQDGQRVFFITSNHLLASDADGTPDLYAYEVGGGLSRLTTDADVSSAVVSPHGDYIYFTAGKQVNGQGADGGADLYEYHDGEITHVVDAEDGAIGLGQKVNSGIPSLLTPDGRHLLFASNEALVGPPSNGHYQLFQYDADGRELRCISCHPDGATPSTDTLFPAGGVSPQRSADQRLQSDDGSTVAFETFESLLPEDTNSGDDVYRWHDGELSLISDPGVAVQRPGWVAGITAQGDGIFFTSHARLTPDAEQDNRKLYLARAGGGFDFTPPAPLCVENECQPESSPGPGAPLLASMTLRSPGGKTTSSRAVRKLQLTASARRNLVANKRAQLVVLAGNTPGRVRIRVSARVGTRWLSISTLTGALRAGARTRTVIHLPRGAHRYLATHGALRVRVVAEGVNGGPPARLELTL